MNSGFQSDHGSQTSGFAISEEKFKDELRRTFELLLKNKGSTLNEILPLSTTQENPLGFDDLYDWSPGYLYLSSPGPPQSDICLESPALLQYKAPKSNVKDLVYEIPIEQYILMRAWQKRGTSAFYVLAKVKTHKDLEIAKEDIFKMAFWVYPEELNISDFSYEKHTLHVDPNTGHWYTQPVKSKRLPVPYDPNPVNFEDRFKEALTTVASHRPQTPEQTYALVILNTFLKFTSIYRKIQGNNYWMSYELKSDTK
jgi:hypothetical protein